MRLRRYLMAAAFMISTSVPGWAATYYIAPKGAKISATADGSQAKPWASVGSAIKVAKGGDTILLMDGLHGGIKLNNAAPDAPVTISSMNGKKAQVEWIYLLGTTRNFVFRDLSIWPSNLNAVERGRLVETGAGVSDVTFENLDIRGSVDAANYPAWTLEDWNKRRFTGIMTYGPRSAIINNKITGISFGIQTLGDNSLIANNRVSGFAGDGMRALGQKSTVRNNTVTDCVQVSANHMDGFQSWRVEGLVLDGNTIMEWTNTKVSPLRCKLQGIGLFDGFYNNLIIQNNVISISAYHGISVYGAQNAKIINNTVVSASGNPAKSPWLRVFPHKNGTPSTDVMVANNLAMSFGGTSSPANRVASIANTVITYPATMFSDVKRFNYIPKVASGFIDTGDIANASKADIMGTPRPVAKGPDRGAFEMQSSFTMKTTSTETASCSATSPTPCTSTGQAGSTSGAKFLRAP
jgi:parallel beta-helix repeat protein